jgi:hypothetical protein
MDQRTPKRDVSPERKAIFYIGMGMIAIGFLTFISVFFTAMSGPRFSSTGPGTFDIETFKRTGSFGTQRTFESDMQSSMTRGVVGMLLMFAGGIMMAVGRSGLAGAGFVLNPEQRRRDLEPFSRAAGGMANDALEEVKPVQKIVDALSKPAAPIVKVRCRSCQELNDEDAKFCKACGSAM